MDNWSPVLSRRAVLASGVVTLPLLAGCSTLSLGENENTASPYESTSPLTRIVGRSDTGDHEPVRLTLVYSHPEQQTERPVWTTVKLPAHGEPMTAVQGLETGAGVYSLTAASKRHANHEVVSFNSLAQQRETDYQFEVVVKDIGDLWVNLNDAGESITIPDYNG